MTDTPRHATHQPGIATADPSGSSSPPDKGPRGIFAPVGVALLIGLVFVSVYLAAFHAPRPHNLPIAAVGSARDVLLISERLNHELPGGFAVRPANDLAAARFQVDHRQAYGAIVIAGGQATLLYAEANGPAVTSLLTGTAAGAARSIGLSFRARDVVPLSSGDTRGLAVFYAAFGLVLAGFLFGSVTYQLAPTLPLPRRLISLATFGVAGGVLITLIAKAYGAVPGSFVGLAAVIALMAVAVGGASMAFVRVFGGLGIGLASIVLLVLGNSTSGGSLPPDYLPGWLHPLSHLLPVGVGVRALNGLDYFHHDGLITAFAVLAAWIVAATALLLVRDELDKRREKRAIASKGSGQIADAHKRWSGRPTRRRTGSHRSPVSTA